MHKHKLINMPPTIKKRRDSLWQLVVANRRYMYKVDTCGTHLSRDTKVENNLSRFIFSCYMYHVYLPVLKCAQLLFQFSQGTASQKINRGQTTLTRQNSILHHPRTAPRAPRRRHPTRISRRFVVIIFVPFPVHVFPPPQRHHSM